MHKEEKPDTLIMFNACTHIHISKNQESYCQTSMSTYSSEYMTEKEQPRERRSKSDECCSKLVMLTDVTNGGGLTASKETTPERSDDP